MDVASATETQLQQQNAVRAHRVPLRCGFLALPRCISCFPPILQTLDYLKSAVTQLQTMGSALAEDIATRKRDVATVLAKLTEMKALEHTTTLYLESYKAFSSLDTPESCESDGACSDSLLMCSLSFTAWPGVWAQPSTSSSCRNKSRCL